MPTVAAIVVTYNRLSCLQTCLQALDCQTRRPDTIFVIDNASTDNTENWMLQTALSLYDGLEYVRMPENSGGAGGFHEGLRRAHQRGFDYYWLMDDDGIPDKNALEVLLSAAESLPMPALLNSLVINKESLNDLAFDVEVTDSHGMRHICKTVAQIRQLARQNLARGTSPFNGTFIKKPLIDKVGYPKKELFIYGDEFDFIFRLRRAGFDTFIHTEAIHRHPPSRAQPWPLFHKYTLNLPHDRRRMYVRIRNRFYLTMTYPELFDRLRVLKDVIVYILFGIKYRKLLLVMQAIKDGVMQRWGREKQIV